MGIICPGIYYDLSDKEYFTYPALSQSGLKLLAKSPHHYKTDIVKETPAIIFGSALHLRLLEPDKYSERMVEQNLKTPKREDRIIYLHKESIDEIEEMARAAESNQIVRNLLGGGKKEVSIFWESDSAYVRCKGKMDLLDDRNRVIIDFKRCKDASYDGFSKQAASLKYHWQAYWYAEGMRSITGNEYRFIFVCIEPAPAYGVALYMISRQDMEKAQAQIEPLIMQYSYCRSEDHWPSYPDNIQDLYLPKWA